MNSEQDLLAPYRRRVAEDVEALLNGLELGYAEVARQAWERRDRHERDLTGASVCLLTADALAGAAEDALPPAIALAFLHAMASTFEDLHGSNEYGDGLPAVWGMPRALNAGDAFFILAQQSVLRLTEKGLADERVLEAAILLTATARDLCDDLLSATAPAPRLGPPFALGAIAAGATPTVVAALATFGSAIGRGEDYETHLARIEVADVAMRRLRDAAHHLAAAP